MFAADVVGREDELAMIDRFLSSAATLPSALILEGEAGIGKSTIWREGVRAAREQSYRVLTSRPARSEGALAFAGSADLIGSAVDEVAPELPLPQRQALEVALLLREAQGAPPDPRTVAVAFLSALRILARQGSVLIAIDDLQWLDEPSARVLAFALRRLESERVAALLTYRVGVGADPLHHELERTLRAGSLETLLVGPLSLGAFHVLVRDRLGMMLPRPVLQQVHAASAGNPFLALEIARAIRQHGGRLDPREPLPVPTEVNALVGERLRALPDATLEALLVASALREPTLDRCAAALRVDDLSNALRPALLAHIIDVEDVRIRFTHPLLAAAAYSRADALRRRDLHRRLAEVAPTKEEQARHLAIAADTPDERVASRLEEAAASAAGRGAPDAAAELLEIAAALTPPGNDDRLHHRRLIAANQHFLAGDLTRARALLERLMGELSAGPLRGRAALSLALVTTDDWIVVRGLCQRVIDEAGDDSALAAEGHYLVGFVHFITGDVGEAQRHARIALEISERGSDEGLIATRLSAVIFFDTCAGTRVRDEDAARALALEERNPEMRTHYLPSIACGFRAMCADRLDEARRLFASAERRLAERGDEYMIGAVRMHQTELEVRHGNWALATRYAEEGLQITERVGLESRQCQLLYATALVDAHRGRIDEARAAAERGRELAELGRDRFFDIQCLAVLGFVELSRGDAAAADRYLRSLPDRLDAQGFAQPGMCAAPPDAIEALVLVGELDLARTLTAHLEEQGRRVDSTRARALAARCEGLIAAATGALDEGIAQFRHALEVDLPEPFERARTLLALGRTHRRAAQRREARAVLGEALATFERLGAPLWAAKARAEVGRIAGRAAGFGLTATERQVADLVARGLTNKEVAATLVVSQRAVEAHLTRIYEKLGVRSRTELARRVAAGELTDRQR